MPFGETIVLPAMVKVGEITQGKQYGNKLKCTPLSVNTDGRCTEDTDEDLKKQVLKQVTQRGSFAIQLSESTKVFNSSHLVVFAFQK